MLETKAIRAAVNKCFIENRLWGLGPIQKWFYRVVTSFRRDTTALNLRKNAINIEHHHALSAIKGMKDGIAFDHDNIFFNNAEVEASCSTSPSLRPCNSGNKALAMAFPNSTPH